MPQDARRRQAKVVATIHNADAANSFEA